MTLRIQLLGPLQVWRDGQPLDLGGPKPHAVVALLSVYAMSGQAVSMQELIDALWESDPPASAQNVIHTYLKRLRRLLEPDRPPHAPSRLVRRVGKGYALDLSGVDLDMWRFRQLVDAAATAERTGEPLLATERLAAALALWQGPLLADLSFLSGHPRLVGLPGERWSAVARYGELALALGLAAQALPVLEEAAAACPLDEPAHARLIRCHHALGKRGEAFTAYQAIRERLAGELGVDPGVELARAHAALLADDQLAARPPDGEPERVAPAQLPADIQAYTGRVDELRRLDKLLTGAPPAAAVTIAAIHGTAGVGKTTLAVHWAHQVADRFPDGQLFVNLNGFDPAGPVQDPATVVRRFLDALGVPPAGLPVGDQAQVDLYRRLLAGRRILIVLDNARDVAQVRPLLPNAPGGFVLLTTRNQLPGLVAAHGAYPLRLDPLPAGEARRLLERRLGGERLAAGPAAVDEIVARCAGLPLALAIVAARAATNPEFGLDALARELSDGLDGLASGDSAADVRSAFSWSYRTLAPAAARLFRLLSVHPGPEIGAAAAASLAGAPPAQVRPWLVELARAHLVTEPAPGRYGMHDLLRAYAGELSRTGDQRDERRAALHRLLDHYAHTAVPAAELLQPRWQPIGISTPLPAVSPEALPDLDRARGWLGDEHPVLLRLITLAGREGFDQHIPPLVWSLGSILEWRGLWYEQATVQNAALAAALRLGDRRLIARSHRGVGAADARLRRFREGRAHFTRALALFEQLDDPIGQASTHGNLAWMADREGSHEDAFRHRRRSLELYRVAGHAAGAASVLGSIGWGHAQLGEYEAALAACEEALAVIDLADDPHWQAVISDTLGFAHHHLGHHDQARDAYEHALALFRKLGDRAREAETLTHLGETLCAAGDPEGARAAWQPAALILGELGDPDAGRVRAMLDALPRSGSRPPVA